MEKILKLIPNKIEDNQDIEKMIQYLNKSIEELDVVIFERQKEKNAYFVVPRKIYDENLVREKNGEKIIGNRNVLTCWQFKTKIMLSIRPMFNPSKSNDKCTFLNIQDLEKENIDFVIKNKYKELINNNEYNIYEENDIEDLESNKERSDSWSKIQTENINAIARKAVDHSTFQEGTVIPTRYHERFIENLSNELIRSGKIDITIVIDNQKFGASINFPNLNRKDKVIKLLFRKKLKEYLSKELNTSYQYIMKIKDQGSKGKIIKLPDESQEYMDFYKGEEKDTFIVKLIKKKEEAIDDGDDEDLDGNDIEETSNETEIIKDFEVGKAVDYIHNYIESQGYTYDKSLIKNLYISLKTKPFVILSGISGTGKSKIVELFAKSIGATSENKRFNLVPVKPDWSDSTDLLGFRNIEGKFTPGIITKVCYEAMMNPELPYFICLDEMNLARVEYYFSDILSLMETRRLNEDNEIITNTLLSDEQIGRDSVSISTYGDVYIPQNLYIIGTVNMDETTFPFSKKVLDRANTIEFNKVDLSYSFEDDDSSFDNFNIKDESKVYHNDFLKSEFLKIRDCKEYKDTAQKAINQLIKINSILEKYNYHFGYRVRDEITFYMIYAVKDNLMSFDEAFDLCVIQKILLKISGSSNEVLDMLLDIFELFNNYRFSNREYLEEKELKDLKEKITDSNEGSDKINYKYKLTNEKLIYMIRRFIRDGFTTFWQ
ncbi:McrB family protein [Clostridium beijerinckii]|uniref:McrB family protein n=2 Tax=Clostridium beijerinckii TaxID=1520 RepID=UPI00098CF02E|nr:AAA family ATPase [Clostridium beijerinckii]NRT80952.1 MoxR-like ATPase [Clostridium beijerinckii]OOM48254.1 5-methylcytosine-specific restriction enzyme B [Clostridium beijerinckii]